MEERWLRWFIDLYKTQMLHQDFYLGKNVFLSMKNSKAVYSYFAMHFPQNLKDLLGLMRT